MTNLNVLFIILGLAVGVGATVLILLPFLKKKGVNTADVLQKVDNGLQEVKKYTDAAKALVPGNKFLNILSVIEKYAEIGVGQAAQLNVSSQLPADQRKKSAENYVYSVLNKLGINVDENIKTIVSGVIENKVYDLKTPEEKKTAQQTAVQSQISQLQTQNSQLQSEKDKLQKENEKLKQTIASIQGAVTPVQNAAAPTNTAQ
ncbi:bZIP transcription factor [Clostridium sp. Mt-5]|uniref:BZIP transcription factor n=1 Tax=Clostridium moutaii TaxID=3240932 RepID=A0ABV4BRP0_9CLOT